MAQFIENIQTRIKTSSSNLALIASRAFVGYVLGLVFALIGQQMSGYGDMAFFFVITLTLAAFYRVSKPWTWSALGIFALICVLIGLVLKMYILIAPGS